MSFRVLVGRSRHNLPTHTPRSGYHGVAEVAKTANIAKMAEKCINCISACPTPPHTNPGLAKIWSTTSYNANYTNEGNFFGIFWDEL